MTKNDDAWVKLFDKHSILDEIEKNGQFTITADEINKFRESRLMTKFDHKANLPELFAGNDLCILPLTRGSYVIGKFNAYHKIEYNNKIKPCIVPFPSHYESIQATISSESAALNCAFVTGILQDVAGEKVMPTVSGRMSTQTFDFTISSDSTRFLFTINNSQCEIDGGYEGDNVLMLIEAKNYTVNDFLVRQLYYPYRLWSSKIRKKILPVFLTYSNDRFSFFKFSFAEVNNYNSLVLDEQRDYIIASEKISITDIQNLVNKVKIVPDNPSVPFPQADSFERIIDLLGLLYNAETGSLNKEFITGNYDFDARQTQYYHAALRYLGLSKTNNRGEYSISDEGKKIMGLSYYRKYLALAETILKHEVFNKALKLYFQTLQPLSKDEVVDIMRNSTIGGVESESTFYRRASSVISWIEWMVSLAETK